MSAASAHLRIDASGQVISHPLEDHLRGVAQLAAHFAGEFGAAEWGHLAGLWHDLGKYRPGFQRYIAQTNDADAHIEGRVGGKDKTHSAAGALWAEKLLADRGPAGKIAARVFAYAIAGHHVGLDDWDGKLRARLTGTDAATELRETEQARPPGTILRPPLPDFDPTALPLDKKTGTPGSFALWVRMLFSALVDADFLDTESFMDAGRAAGRAGALSIADLCESFNRAAAAREVQMRLSGLDQTPVNRIRAEVLRQCLDKAKLSTGIYTLTVPTGGGKTLSSLGFALRHALQNGKQRVIYAIPYTSIIEQTADVFRGLFGDSSVIEHHSNVDSEPAQETHRSRLACENWDAPLIVTTNVQLFESLFARRTSRCRKLHNLVNSVIVLDEAQLLPVPFLQPVLDALRLLVEQYGVTLVFCTATQPALTSASSFDSGRSVRGFDPGRVIEIIDDVPALYSALKRVRVHIPDNFSKSRSWKELADEISGHRCALSIVSRRADARELYEEMHAVAAEGLWHLSGLMCAQHRSDTITAIKEALCENQGPVRVVSTQLIEAGVDLDFPVVYRAMAGLDSIAQAAGRCNREGRLSEGTVHVFVPPSKPPPGLLTQAEAACKRTWAAQSIDEDPLDLTLFPRYFRSLYDGSDTDEHDICRLLAVARDGGIRFKEASEKFRLIDDQDAATVFVDYRSPHVASDAGIGALIGKLEQEGPSRWLMRKLQRYAVTIYQRDLNRLLLNNDIRELRQCPGVYVQIGATLYNNTLGLSTTGVPGDPAQLVI